MSAAAPGLFAMFVKLAGRNCVVIGGGDVAESKAQSLLAAGAKVTVISPDLTSRLAHKQRLGAIRWCARTFEPCDLEGAFLAIAATSDDAVNELVYRECERRGILCNVVDQPPRCHFYFPALVQRGDLQIAISTAGKSPSLAQRLRKEMEKQFGPEYRDWLMWLGEVRKALMTRRLSFERRRRLLALLVRQESFEHWREMVRDERALTEAA